MLHIKISIDFDENDGRGGRGHKFGQGRMLVRQQLAPLLDFPFTREDSGLAEDGQCADLVQAVQVKRSVIHQYWIM